MSEAKFSVIRLHDQSERCWAVVRSAGGAIAEDGEGRLLMRFTLQEAQRVADRLSLEGGDGRSGPLTRTGAAS